MIVLSAVFLIDSPRASGPARPRGAVRARGGGRAADLRESAALIAGYPVPGGARRGVRERGWHILQLATVKYCKRLIYAGQH